ncbi:MAG TPA: hypothetical protein IAB15_01825 [Candidatus Ornithoclostridium faecigallinarum]|nr:hypothetical protein [Candidatus Ornithoclostridium faecigallinarum]
MKKLLATFAVTTLLVILAVSAVSCVYRPDGDRTIDYVRGYDVDEIPFVK